MAHIPRLSAVIRYPTKCLIRPRWIVATGLLLAVAAAGDRPVLAQPADAFVLRSGDRVVFVGDGLFEHAQRFGYIERALTTRWPVRNLTFRNVGWSGDTVFGEARGHYTNPPTAFEHLIEQITTPRPTVVIFGYGGTLADEDTGAIATFVDGYNQLLDTVAVSRARCVLLAPIPHDVRTSPNPEVAHLNKQLRRGRDAVEQVARERRCGFVDLFTPMKSHFQQSSTPLTFDGVHLNAEGYLALATVLENSLSGSIRLTDITLDVATNRVDGGSLKRDGGSLRGDVDQQNTTYRFTLVPDALLEDAERARTLRVTALQRGSYVLSTGGTVIATASAGSWADGVDIILPGEAAQGEALRRLIVEKNQLYFRQYRPQNETYLVGFRRYEQGQNATELDQLTPLIHEKENEIGRLSMSRAVTFTLRRE